MNSTDSFTDSKYYELFINNGSNYSTYWMSTRCIYAHSNDAYFGVSRVNSGLVGAGTLYNASGIEDPYGYGFRPVITLNSNVQVTSGNGTAEQAYAIK